MRGNLSESPPSTRYLKAHRVVELRSLAEGAARRVDQDAIERLRPERRRRKGVAPGVVDGSDGVDGEGVNVVQAQPGRVVDDLTHLGRRFVQSHDTSLPIRFF